MLPKLALMGVLAGLLVPAATHAEGDIEYHYGFTMGTNIGGVGEKEIEISARAATCRAINKRLH